MHHNFDPANSEDTISVLIIDDLEDNRTLLRLDLEDELPGVELEEAVDGKDALNLLENRDFSVVICDVMMPDLSGFEVFDRFTKNHPKRIVPFIFLSANKQKESVETGLKLGAFDYITKPYELGELIAKVKNLAHHKRLMNSLLVTQNELLRSYESLSSYIREKDENLAMISHDMKTPLMSISGLSAELNDEMEEGDLQMQIMLKAISSSTGDLIALTKKLNAIVHDESSVFSLDVMPTDINSLVREVLAAYIILARQKGIEVSITELDQNLKFLLDPEKLKQCVANLFYNAVKFTNRNGRISAIIEYSNETLCLCIKDSGIGIPEHLQAKLFQKFSGTGRKGTENEKGSGLGLSIVKRYTEMMGGNVSVRSEIGKGSEFILEFKNLKMIHS